MKRETLLNMAVAGVGLVAAAFLLKAFVALLPAGAHPAEQVAASALTEATTSATDPLPSGIPEPAGATWRISARFTPEDGPSVLAVRLDTPCTLGAPFAGDMVPRTGDGLSASKEWYVCTREDLPTLGSAAYDVWETPQADVFADGETLVIPAVDLGGSAIRPVVVFAAGYCEDDGWCSAVLSADGSGRSGIKASLEGRGTRTMEFVRSQAQPSDWDELPSEDSDAETLDEAEE